MEEDQEFKHFCKLCSKSFPCGRSLGGHMRSHLINSNSIDTDDQKLIKSRVTLSSLSNYTETAFETGPQAGYGLRENPKRTWRIADSSEDTSLCAADNKLCRECGKGFQSWKALFAHMKCHSNSITNSFENEQDSWTSDKVMDSQSENEATNTTRRRRTTSRRRRRTRYMGTTTTTSSSNFSIANNNASSSVTEIEQEQQEEVALCLMMLSRDVGHWGGLKFVADLDHSTSDNNSGFSDAPSYLRMNRISEIKGKNSVSSATLETFKLKKLKKKMSEEEASVGGFSKNDKFNKNLVKKIELTQAQLGSNKFNSSNKRKLQDAYDHSSPKRSRYECGTCNKVFRSYQALGGHRASHKKIKGCFASKIESSENTTEFDRDLSPDHPIASGSKLSSLIDHQDVVKAESISTKSKGHSCPICLKVFPTGQALGGHKRSHVIGGSAESKNSQSTIVIPKPATPEVRDFLDLNLPAPVEEESSTSHAAAQAFKPWWVGSSHKPEALVS